jgi:methylated-DNA-protein-cysteine methyltransferase related protein
VTIGRAGPERPRSITVKPVDREEYVEAVLTAVESIPPGQVATYGDIATYVGQGGPRQVGAVMREYGGGVPWWRVIRASGIPADEVLEEQVQRLRGDGVRVTDRKVNLKAARWNPSTPEA